MTTGDVPSTNTNVPDAAMDIDANPTSGLQIEEYQSVKLELPGLDSFLDSTRESLPQKKEEPSDPMAKSLEIMTKTLAGISARLEKLEEKRVLPSSPSIVRKRLEGLKLSPALLATTASGSLTDVPVIPERKLDGTRGQREPLGHGSNPSGLMPYMSKEELLWRSRLAELIPTFNGDIASEGYLKQFRGFIEAAKSFFKHSALSDSLKLLIVTGKFTDAAKAWWKTSIKRFQSEDEACERISPQEFWVQFELKFIPKRAMQILFAKLATMRQGTKSPKEYQYEFLQTAMLYQCKDPQILADLLMVGLNVRTKDRLYASGVDVTNYDALIQQMAIFDIEEVQTSVVAANQVRTMVKRKQVAQPKKKSIGQRSSKCFVCDKPGHRAKDCKEFRDFKKTKNEKPISSAMVGTESSLIAPPSMYGVTITPN